MTGLRRSSATPFLIGVAPRVCSCKLPAKELGMFKRPQKAIAEISGYWNVYVGFFGDQMMWLDFTVTDVRDGRVVWKNGRQLTEEDYGATQDGAGNESGGNRKARPGQWIAGSRNADW